MQIVILQVCAYFIELYSFIEVLTSKLISYLMEKMFLGKWLFVRTAISISITFDETQLGNVSQGKRYNA